MCEKTRTREQISILERRVIDLDKNGEVGIESLRRRSGRILTLLR